MYTNQINRCLAYLNIQRFGVYASDQLPIVVDVPNCFIINTDPHTKPGQHWIAIFINANRELTYFDSYGFPPFKQEYYTFIKRNSRTAKFNTMQLQDLQSKVCGQYCIMFIYFKTLGASLEDYLSLFTNNTRQNDYIINEMFESNFHKHVLK